MSGRPDGRAKGGDVAVASRGGGVDAASGDCAARDLAAVAFGGDRVGGAVAAAPLRADRVGGEAPHAGAPDGPAISRRAAFRGIGALGLLGAGGLPGGAALGLLGASGLPGGVALGLLGAGGLFAPGAARANELRVGKRAPVATLVTLDGKRLSTTDLVGQVVIVTFLATWCEPCREELPLLSDYMVAHAARGLTVLGFSLDEPDRIDAVRVMAAPLRFPVGLLALSSAPGYGRIWHIPVSFTIDRAGLLVDDGWKDRRPVWTPERLERVVTPLLI